IAARGKGTMDGINEDEVLGLLQSMVKQRRESIKFYEKGGRMELAQQEAEEIAVIKRFLPEQLTADEISEAIQGVIDEVGAASLKEIGMVMGALKERDAGRMDSGKASAMGKGRLG
ncbi:MAG: GatB/YqeY domain-containing protein, partial [Rhodospirillales bacterium]|nr:GatB/YqeY domain-containing protein [Rhodospirillales bacterium]